MKTYLFAIRFKYFVDREDLVGLVKTNNIEEFLSNYCKDMLDDIEGYEYQEVQKVKENEVTLLCGAWSGSEFIKEVLNPNKEEETIKWIGTKDGRLIDLQDYNLDESNDEYYYFSDKKTGSTSIKVKKSDVDAIYTKFNPHMLCDYK